jgi:hypothetical protein
MKLACLHDGERDPRQRQANAGEPAAWPIRIL